jgi:HEAT repeat protein
VSLLAAASLSAAQTRKERAWQLLEDGAKAKNFSTRAVAVRVLGLLPGDAHALAIAEKALQDEDDSVRTAAATALGQIGIKRAVPDLRDLLNDRDTGVVLAAAHALTALGDETGYDVYYVILTRQRKSSGSALQDEKKILKDHKQLAKLGFEQGIGYVPFAGYGYGAIRALTKDDTSPVRAGAAKALAMDPDPASAAALAEATWDHSWIVRAAALDALARRGDPSVLRQIEHAMGSGHDAVKYTAAAAVIRLTTIRDARAGR